MTFIPNKIAVEAAAKAIFHREESSASKASDTRWNFLPTGRRDDFIATATEALTAYHASLEARGLARPGRVQQIADIWQVVHSADNSFPVLIIRTGEA